MGDYTESVREDEDGNSFVSGVSPRAGISSFDECTAMRATRPCRIITLFSTLERARLLSLCLRGASEEESFSLTDDDVDDDSSKQRP